MNFNAAFPFFESGSCHLDWASNVEIGVECQIFVIVIFFSLPLSFTIWGTFKISKGNSKEIIFSALYYFQIRFSCRLKKSKQTFNTKFVIRRPNDMIRTLHPRKSHARNGRCYSTPRILTFE